MTEPQHPGPGFTDAWRTERTYLIDLAYRMLGNIGDAEDIVQEAFIRLAGMGPDRIDSPRAWLTVVTSRLCLDLLRSGRTRREHPGDPAELGAAIPVFGHPPTLDPADRVTLDDEVQSALLVVLQRLAPAERVSFVLHDVFAMGFDAIADTLGRPVGTCRQLARRARHKIAEAGIRAHLVEPPEHRLVTQRFIAACAGGDIAELLAVLHPEAWGLATFNAASGLPPVLSSGPEEVADNLIRYYRAGVTLVSVPAPTPLVLGYLRRTFFAALALTVQDGRIVRIDARVTLQGSMDYWSGAPRDARAAPDNRLPTQSLSSSAPSDL